VFCAALVCFQFWFVTFWQKEIGKKADCKMLVKLLTSGVNFINVFARFFRTKFWRQSQNLTRKAAKM